MRSLALCGSAAALATTILAGCVDLVVSQVSPTWVPGSRLVRAEIANQGSKESGEFSASTTVYGRSEAVYPDRLVPMAMLNSSKTVSSIERSATQWVDFLFPDFPSALFNPAAVRKVTTRADTGNVVSETSELNNTASACVARQVPESVCWLQDPCLINLSDFDLTIRTVNTKEGGGDLPEGVGSGTGGFAHYQDRLQAIATLFHQDWPQDIGIIGLQEVRDLMTNCPGFSTDVGGALCFSNILGNTFGTSGVDQAQGIGNLGMVAGNTWEILAVFAASLDSGDDRWMLETKLKHRTHGWILRFYSTHFSHRSDTYGPQEDMRNEQSRNLADMVRTRAASGELPPIVVGDFNFSPDLEPSTFGILNGTFRLLNELYAVCINNIRSYDQIWVGRPEAFPNAVGRYIPLRFSMTPGQQGIDLRSPALSDHDSPGFALRVVGAPRAAVSP